MSVSFSQPQPESAAHVTSFAQTTLTRYSIQLARFCTNWRGWDKVTKNTAPSCSSGLLDELKDYAVSNDKRLISQNMSYSTKVIVASVQSLLLQDYLAAYVTTLLSDSIFKLRGLDCSLSCSLNTTTVCFIVWLPS